ncbi:Uncharacterised protein [Clostridioides difficile]|uniref:Uncharacterized protein n=1 Tax=Clostridioides difficile TaxID=1496 RepID=A0A069ABL0_CLODI|nr:hypothetical protein [Clostridioides difficile]EQG75194.1 hypothetical protein QKA_1717 [Clostridioides difficile DA00165]EQK93973.1 hypothetical protein QEG_3646 [Clostridioides difficile CD127]DAG69502.1 MAG TPA: hypothetical protein [Caudoviricetes sp.]ALP05155.1 hypothetical protein PCZ31_3256 [Clostridioides difficile]AXB60739.1 hypothetical protein CDIF27638_01664 [Clostridioides difficile]
MGRLERRKNKRENKFNKIKNAFSFTLVLINLVLAILRLIKEL